MILIIDNYDSFTYNLVHLLGSAGAQCRVVLNDSTTLEQIEALSPQGLLLSAGPGTPDEAGLTLAAIARFQGRLPLLGICLGHQAIAQSFGARIVGGGRLLHGKTSPVEHDGRGLFAGLPVPLHMARYNSLLVDEASVPPTLEVSARSDHGEIMALRHRSLAIEGVQFHPESALSEHGKSLIHNWLKRL